MKIIEFSKSAPIVPGQSVAGIQLGTTLPDVSDLLDRLCHRQGSVVLSGPLNIRYLLGSSVWLNVCLRECRIQSVGVSQGYTGLIENKIGIGSTLDEAEKSLGPLDWERKDPGYWPERFPGVELCVDSEENELIANRHLPINQILVFNSGTPD